MSLTIQGLVNEMATIGITICISHWSIHDGQTISLVDEHMGNSYKEACDAYLEIRLLIAEGAMDFKMETLRACERILDLELSSYFHARCMAQACRASMYSLALAKRVEGKERSWTRSSIYVGGLSIASLPTRTAAIKALKSMFDACGTVVYITLPPPNGRKYRNYAVIRFKYELETVHAIAKYDGAENMPFIRAGRKLHVIHLLKTT